MPPRTPGPTPSRSKDPQRPSVLCIVDSSLKDISTPNNSDQSAGRCHGPCIAPLERLDSGLVQQGSGARLRELICCGL